MIDALLPLARRLRKTVGGDRAWNVVRPVYWKTMSALAGDRGAAVTFTDGQRYRVDPEFYGWGIDEFEPSVVRWLTETLAGTSVLYDVGAHVGIMTLIAARRVAPPRGRVYAFEPSPPNVALLERHVRINGFTDRVSTHRVLVGDCVRDDVPFVHRRDQFTANSLAYAIDDGETTATPMTTIDRFVAEGARPPTHLKIDVEGFEAAVLRGARATLQACRPLVICAMHPEPLARLGETAAGIVEFMRQSGYAGFDLSGRAATDPGFEEIVFRAA